MERERMIPKALSRHGHFRFRLSFVGVCLVFVLAPSAFAVSMSGDISITGGARFNKGNLMKASDVTSWINPVIVTDSGGFTAFAPSGSAVTMTTPWFFGASTQSSVLWSGDGFNLDLTSSTILSQGKKSLTVSGAGTISGNGFDATAGDWTFTFTKGKKHTNGFVFTFTPTSSADSPSPTTQPPAGGPVAAVPDSGSTLALLALAVVGLFCLQSKRGRLA